MIKKYGFVKNSLFNLGGDIFQIIIGIIFTMIFIRSIGVEGYAKIGIMMTIISVFSIFDYQYSLSLVRYNMDFYKNKTKFNLMVNTLFSSVLFVNGLLLLLLFLVIPFRSLFEDFNTFIILLVAILIFILSRTNTFIINFFRANRNEAIVQYIELSASILELIVALVLLFLGFDFFSIIISTLLISSVKYIFLQYHMRKIVKYNFVFSSKCFLKSHNNFSKEQYVSKILRNLTLASGMIMGYFFLSTVNFGILTLLVSANSKLSGLFDSYRNHINPIYSKYIKIKDTKILINKIMYKIAFISNKFYLLLFIFLITIGESIYNSFYGSEMYGTYYLFVLLCCSIFFNLSVSSYKAFLMVFNIKAYRKIVSIALIPYLLLMLINVKEFDLFGLILSYSMYYVIMGIVFVICVNRLDEKSSFSSLNQIGLYTFEILILFSAFFLVKNYNMPVLNLYLIFFVLFGLLLGLFHRKFFQEIQWLNKL